MSIHDKNLFGMTRYETAIERIKTFCAGKKVLCAFSGGKDSQTCYHLLKDAGIDFHAEYSITRFEPPELMKFIVAEYPDVTFRRAYKMPLIAEIEYSGLPNMWARWCCNAKHVKTDGYDICVIGIRWDESARRRDNWRIFGYKQDKSAYLCPIADWTDADVWEYIGDRTHCCLYDQGFKRIGCVCCPLAANKMQADAVRWPKTAAMLKIGGDRYVQRMRARGFLKMNGGPCADWCKADNPEAEYFRRWIATGQTARGSVDALNDGPECLFAGTGFSEADGLEDDETDEQK